MVTPFPGTPFFERAKKKGCLTTLNWERCNGTNNAAISYLWLKKEQMEQLHKEAVSECGRRMRKRAIVRKLRRAICKVKVALHV